MTHVTHIFRFLSKGRCGARLLQFTNRFTACSSYPIELKLGRMVLDISPLDRSASDCSISPRGAVGGAHFEIFKPIHSLKFYLIELKFSRKVLDLSPLDRSEPDFSISFQGRAS